MMTVFSAYAYTEAGERLMRVTDQRSGDEWDEPAHGWALVHVLAGAEPGEIGSYYRHKDGRIAAHELLNTPTTYREELTPAGLQLCIPGTERTPPKTGKPAQLSLFP